jgi:glycosyltransferase involved in cell wall biosynthesis
MKDKKIRVLICGVLPPPYFGHSMLYEMLMRSSFPFVYNVKFLNMHFWSYETDKKVTSGKLFMLIKYYCQYLWLILFFRPCYVLFNISFYNTPFFKDFLFCSTGILLGRRVVLHDHGQYVRELHDSLPKNQDALLRWMLRKTWAGIIMGEKVRKDYDGLVEQNRLFVVPATVEDSKRLAVMVEKREELNVLFFSYMSKLKGIDVAFKVADIILGQRLRISFTFGGPLENSLVKEKLESLQKKFPGRIKYLGYVEDSLKRTKAFREADIFIFPTLRDVFGHVLLHAMAEGVPIVASREGTIPEIIKDGKNGYLCEKEDHNALVEKILVLVEDPLLREKISKENRSRFLEYYNLKKYGARMVETFQRIAVLT